MPALAGVLTCCALFHGAGLITPASAQEDITVRVQPVQTNETIPIKLSGFSSSVHKVLEFDLAVVGFKVTSRGAYFELKAAESGVGGTLFDLRGGPNQIFAQRFTGGSERSRAHALADKVVTTVRKVPGIGKSQLIFRARTSGRTGNSEIYLADFDGHAARPITADKTVAKDPVYSPVTRTAYYLSYMKSSPRIVRHNLSSGQRNIFAGFGGTSFSPSISPDGQKVASILSRDGNPELYVASAGGTGWSRLTRTKSPEFSPCWSPDGQQICFASKSSGHVRLYLIDANGGSARPLNTGGAVNTTEPDWSPDGKYIAFSRQTRGSFFIAIVPASGGSHSIIIEGEDPSWSPNSRTLAFSKRESNGSRVISLLDVPTKQVKDLPLSSLGSCSQPSWGR